MAERRDCGTMPLHFAAVESEQGYAETRRMNEVLLSSMRTMALPGVVRIPVVVHIVASGAAPQVSDQQVQEQIARLNLDFRAQNADIDRIPPPFSPLASDAMIEFALATRDPSGQPTNGIIRKQTTIDVFPENDVPPGESRSNVIMPELALGDTGSIAWPAENYLNIWVCDMAKRPLGFAAFPASAPWRDGVVIDSKCFGESGSAAAPFHMGRTATHEVGHWLGLLHIWGDDSDECSRSDNIADTPNQASSNEGQPVFPSVTCENGPHGDMFMNYMDYVDDVAMFMFSRDQVRRMRATLQGTRAGLLSSKGLVATAAHGALFSNKGLIEISAFGRPGSPEEQVFDGVSWVPVEAD